MHYMISQNQPLGLSLQILVQYTEIVSDLIKYFAT